MPGHESKQLFPEKKVVNLNDPSKEPKDSEFNSNICSLFIRVARDKSQCFRRFFQKIYCLDSNQPRAQLFKQPGCIQTASFSKESFHENNPQEKPKDFEFNSNLPEAPLFEQPGRESLFQTAIFQGKSFHQNNPLKKPKDSEFNSNFAQSS